MHRLSLFALFVAAPLCVTSVGAQGKTESFDGYAEWRKGPDLVVDGQRVRATSATRFKGAREAREFAGIPLGYEVKVTGIRQPDGVVYALTVEAKPNGTAMFEAELVNSTRQLESFLLENHVLPSQAGDRRLQTSGPLVDRVRQISLRLIPPYRSRDDFHFYVVEDNEWNASAYPNGMVIVNQGLLRDLDDDEIALVLGHELVHATHEHSRRGRKRDMMVGLLTTAGAATLSESTSGGTRAAALQAIALTGAAASNGFSRDHEDQADRVGVRYAYEGGFDVTKGPRLWLRFADKYGEGSRTQNFFFGDHSLASARAENLRRELTVNYPELRARLGQVDGRVDPSTTGGYRR